MMTKLRLGLSAIGLSIVSALHLQAPLGKQGRGVTSWMTITMTSFLT